MVIVRVSTRTMRSTTGMRMMRPGPLVGDDPSQAEDDGPLVFVEDPDGRGQKHDDEYDNDNDRIQHKHPLLRFFFHFNF